MQLCYGLEVRTFVLLKIFQGTAIMAILLSITPLLNSQTSNKHFELSRDLIKNSTLFGMTPNDHTSPFFILHLIPNDHFFSIFHAQILSVKIVIGQN